MRLKLITESISTIDFITEGSGDKKNHYIVGPVLVAGVKNGNGRIYPQGILENEVGRYLKEVVANGQGYGELGHPDTPAINLERVSHMVESLTQDKNVWIGKARIAATPMGQIAVGLQESGAKLGASSRGLGTVKTNRDGLLEVQSNFRLATAFDIVANPSAPGAFVQGIMENVEWIYDPVKGTYLEERLENAKREFHNTPKSDHEAKTLALWEEIMSRLARS